MGTYHFTTHFPFPQLSFPPLHLISVFLDWIFFLLTHCISSVAGLAFVTLFSYFRGLRLMVHIFHASVHFQATPPSSCVGTTPSPAFSLPSSLHDHSYTHASIHSVRLCCNSFTFRVSQAGRGLPLFSHQFPFWFCSFLPVSTGALASCPEDLTSPFLVTRVSWR